MNTSDAIRIRVPISLLEEVDAGYIFGEDFKFENSAMFLRGKFYYYRTDFSLLLTGFQENFIMGFDNECEVVGTIHDTKYKEFGE